MNKNEKIDFDQVSIVKRDRSALIFDNPISNHDYQKAIHSKQRFIKRFGDDHNKDYPVTLVANKDIGDLLGVSDLLVGQRAESVQKEEREPFDHEKGIIVGNIRMGFGHYRIAMAMASAAHALGYHPYWMDLNSYPDTTCTKVISAQNDLYSKGSRISQKSQAFNRIVWEPMNYEGFRKLSYNASDQKNSELMAPVFHNIPKDIPLIATHVWPAQAALHGNMKYVVNAIPDNWPMALHLAEGSLHTIQTHQAYQGYRILNGMEGSKVLRPMPEGSLVYTGHYVDHELTAHIEEDCEARIHRKEEKQPMRFLLTIGGAGAQREIFAGIIRYLLPLIKEKKAMLYINVGDYRNVWDQLCKEISGLQKLSVEHFDHWQETQAFAQKALDEPIFGIHAFYHQNIFQAVYCTNLLMRSTDVLVTKPSELTFYPIPKLFIHRIGGHEKWGAIHSAEMGDGTLECEDLPHVIQMLELFLNDSSFLQEMCQNIMRNKKMGLYDGAYKVVKLAMEMRGKHNEQ